MNFALGAKGDGQALGAITVDREVPDKQAAALRGIPGILALEVV